MPVREQLDRVDVLGVRRQADVGAVEVHGEGPAVVVPSEVASKRTTSESSIVPATPADRAVRVEGEQERVRVEPGEGVDAEAREPDVGAVEGEAERRPVEEDDVLVGDGDPPDGPAVRSEK